MSILNPSKNRKEHYLLHNNRQGASKQIKQDSEQFDHMDAYLEL